MPDLFFPSLSNQECPDDTVKIGMEAHGIGLHAIKNNNEQITFYTPDVRQNLYYDQLIATQVVEWATQTIHDVTIPNFDTKDEYTNRWTKLISKKTQKELIGEFVTAKRSYSVPVKAVLVAGGKKTDQYITVVYALRNNQYFAEIRRFISRTQKDAIIAVLHSKVFCNILMEFQQENGNSLGAVDALASMIALRDGYGIDKMSHTGHAFKRLRTSLKRLVDINGKADVKAFLRNYFSRNNLSRQIAGQDLEREREDLQKRVDMQDVLLQQCRDRFQQQEDALAKQFNSELSRTLTDRIKNFARKNGQEAFAKLAMEVIGKDNMKRFVQVVDTGKKRLDDIDEVEARFSQLEID